MAAAVASSLTRLGRGRVLQKHQAHGRAVLLVLDLDELDVSDEAQHLDNVTDDLVSEDCLDQLDLVVGLEVGYLVLD